MARELIVGWAGKHHREPWKTLCADLRRRIARYSPIRDVVVRTRRTDEPGRLDEEAAALLAALPEPCRVVALTRSGRQLGSEELAAWLARERAEWPHALAFLIGSDLGLGSRVVERSSLRLSLGPMTLTHETARLVLYEQLYRAFAIEHGIKYHRAPF
ncbi:MAG TPA: 23S rRNA (pseudouridine(1915)-N(3))-methyltransferase RlmH [Thermoanaerobaculia bacterium]|nr:23S rRNA (pseudouridine(1915)-N(3))-methyltransferase RlmH [Thermoanaerobaculia bacterium]